jgi:putative ABC transport system ATP-binding protein
MLKLKDIFVVFDTGTYLEKAALRGINFEIGEHELVTVVGNAGCGKSTLLKLLSGHFRPNFGRIWLGNQDVTSQTLDERSKKFTFVSYNQEGGVAENLTVAENLAVAGMHHQPRSIFTPAINRETHEAYYEQLKQLDFFAMENVLDEKVYDISHMHKFILSLLVAIMKNAEVLLVDANIIGLVKEEQKALIDVMTKIIRSQKTTAIIAANDPTFALEIADRTLVLSHGQVVADLFGETKKKTKTEDLFAAFKIVPRIKDVKPSCL